ncbi:MAG TPA: hypothetical protein VHZ54_09145 [Solirubrobacterales bacterium]|jgi:hypothetical protein|nr:hypothetical protein [Solirubrobacterales bacterium]
MPRRIAISLVAVATCAYGVAALVPATAGATRAELCTKTHAGESTTTKYSDSKCQIAESLGSYHRWIAPGALHTHLIIGFEQHLSTTIGGIAFEVSCEDLRNSGGVEENVEAGAIHRVSGNELTLEFSECEVDKPVGRNCEVHEPITSSQLDTNAIDGEGRTEVEFDPESGTSLGSLVIEHCTIAALNGNKAMTGSFKGFVPVGEQSVVEFTKTIKESADFKIGGQVAGYIGKTSAEKQPTEETAPEELIFLGLF